jgi:diguanylate cyclase (GGDEF)-like protein
MLLKKLVIAEDDEDTSYLLSAALGDAGFLCLRARNGEEALNLARTETPDAMVLDVMMPKLDGIEVCRRIKGDVLLSRIPILILTSLAGVDDRVAGLEAGADDYLPKPFDIRELTARIRALIRQSRRERDRNPTTGLPAGEAIEERVDELLKAQQPFAVLYIDIENYRSYADVYGFRKANEAVAHFGNLILQRGRRASDPPPFVGHVGGDDFIVICEPGIGQQLSKDIAAAIRSSVDQFYSEEDRKRGHLFLPGETEEFKRVNFMNPSIALVPVEPGLFKSSEDLAREVTKTKFLVRKRTRSGSFPRFPSG